MAIRVIRAVNLFRKNKKFDPSDPNSQRYEPVQPEQNFSPAPNYSPAPVQPTPVATVPSPAQSQRQQVQTNIAAVQPAAPAPKMATLKNDQTGERRAVAVDSEEAKALYGQGYRLEGSGEAPGVNTPIATDPSNTGQPGASGDALNDRTTAAAGESAAPTLDYNELARQAAEAGMSVKDYADLIKSGASSTEAQRKEVLDSLGIPDLVKEYYDKPSLDTQKLYVDKYNEIGLTDVKNSISKLDAEIAKVDEQFNEAFQEYNNNPFLSAGTRDFRIRTAMEARDRKIANINNQRASYVDLYNRGLDELDKYITRAAGQYETDRTMTADKLNYLFNEANRLVSAKESEQQREQVLRYVPEFLKESSKVKRGKASQQASEKAYKDLEKKFTAPYSDANFDAFISAIGGQESNGDPNARNARTGAYGMFQIMPENWEPWSQEYLAATGQNPNQSLDSRNPSNQAAVARYKMRQYYERFGNWADVASMWYSGRPFYQVLQEGWADTPQGPNGDEPSVREYVNSVITSANLSTEEGRVTPQSEKATDGEKRMQRDALRKEGFSPTQVQEIERKGLLFAPYEDQLAATSKDSDGGDNPYA